VVIQVVRKTTDGFARGQRYSSERVGLVYWRGGDDDARAAAANPERGCAIRGSRLARRSSGVSVLGGSPRSEQSQSVRRGRAGFRGGDCEGEPGIGDQVKALVGQGQVADDLVVKVSMPAACSRCGSSSGAGTPRCGWGAPDKLVHTLVVRVAAGLGAQDGHRVSAAVSHSGRSGASRRRERCSGRSWADRWGLCRTESNAWRGRPGWWRGAVRRNPGTRCFPTSRRPACWG
jgi:hypothetical protein